MTTQNQNIVFTYDEEQALNFDKCTEQEKEEYEKQFQEELNNADD